MRQVDLSISIVSYFSADVLSRCLKSILDSAQGIHFEITVLDNASNDGALEAARLAFPAVEVLQNTLNEGFGKAHNRMLRRAKGRYALVLNPDTIVLPGALQALVEFMDNHPDAGMAGCRNWLDDERRFQIFCRPTPSLRSAVMECTSFGRFFPNSRPARSFWNTPANLAIDAPVQVSEVLGSAILVRMEAAREAGLFDETFFLYYEEYDWYRRMISCGRKIYLVPHAELIHLAGQSSRKSDPDWIAAISRRSRDHYFRKYYGPLGLCFIKLLRGSDALGLWLHAKHAHEFEETLNKGEGVQLHWREVPGAQEYLVEISLNSAFLNLAATRTSAAAIFLGRKFLQQLPAPRIFWRVSPIMSDGAWGKFIRRGVVDGCWSEEEISQQDDSASIRRGAVRI
jgi:hypothetical protein